MATSGILQRYEKTGDIIGDDQNGISTVKELSSGVAWVRKAVCTEGMPSTTRQMLHSEAQLLREVQDHPCIVKLRETEQVNENQSILILEYLSGGDCGHLVEKTYQNGDMLDEAFVAKLIRQLLSAISHCHSRGIVHRDIKTENLVLTEAATTEIGSPTRANRQNTVRSADSQHDCKLIDFGYAAYCKANMSEIVGTASYWAPELHRMSPQYTSKVDVWATGVVAFELLTGMLPFGREDPNGGSAKEVRKRIKQCTSSSRVEEELSRAPRWDQLSQGARGLLLQLLQPDPSERPTAAEAESHHWLQKPLSSSALGGS